MLITFIVLLIWIPLLWFYYEHYRLLCHWKTLPQIGSDLFIDSMFPRDFPFVTIQIPVYNEEPENLARILDACATLYWRKDRLQVQVLDDSTGLGYLDSKYVVDQCRKKYPFLTLDLLHRNICEGFKAGALQKALPLALGEYIAVFDVDFDFAPDWLRRTYFQLSKSICSGLVGCMQTRWTYRNRNQNIITRTAAALLDGHFVIEKPSRHASRHFVGFNGSGGLWRKKCIEEAGGWSSDTLSEDTDLSYRAQLKGWRIAYTPWTTCSSELPTKLGVFITQQKRWVKGASEVARKHMYYIWHSNKSFAQKLSAVFNLSAWPLSYCWSFFGLLIGLLFIKLNFLHFGLATILISTPFLLTMPYYYQATKRWTDVLAMPLIGLLAMLPLTFSVHDVLWGKKTGFVRTPKKGL